MSCLQADSLTMPKATRLIARQTEVFSARKQKGGEKYELAVACVCLMQDSVKAANKINKQQFYHALVDFTSVRLMPDSDNVLVQCV